MRSKMRAYLVAVPPKVVLRPYILIGVLRAFLQRRHVLPMVPMFIPKIPRIDRGDEKAGNSNTAFGSVQARKVCWIMY